MRMSDWSSDVCSSDLRAKTIASLTKLSLMISLPAREASPRTSKLKRSRRHFRLRHPTACLSLRWPLRRDGAGPPRRRLMFFRNSMKPALRSEEHTSDLQSLMRTSYADFCLKQKRQNNQH